MKTVVPLKITDTNLASTSISEPDTANGDPAVWSSEVTYAADAEVSLTSTHRIYVSVQSSNTGNDPSTDDGTWWVEKQATNAWAMFDSKVNTQTVQSTNNSNLVSFPEDFDNAAWTKTRTTVSANVETAPDGTVTADKIIATSGEVSSSRYVYDTYSLSAGTTYVMSVFAKAGEYKYMRITNFGIAGTFVTVDLIDGDIVTTGSLADSATVSDVGGGGWYRVALLFTAQTTTNYNIGFYIGISSDLDPFEGDDSSGIYLWGAQLEEYVLTDYMGSGSGRIDVSITPGEVMNSLALLNMQATKVHCLVIDPDEGLVYQAVKTGVSNSGITDWYSYYFTPIERVNTISLLDLPAYPAATIRLIAYENSGEVAVGSLVMGNAYEVGVSLHGTSVGIINYDRKTVDAFGNTVVQPISFSKRADFDVRLSTSRTGAVQTFLANSRSTPVLWVGSGEYESTIVYGFFRDFSIILKDAVYSDCNIQIEGLI